MTSTTSRSSIPMHKSARPLGGVDSLRWFLRLRGGNMLHYEDLQRRHGDMVRLRIPTQEDVIFVFHPAGVRHVLVHHGNRYGKGRRYAELALVLGNGLVNAEGEAWRLQREKLGHLFTTEGVRQLATTMTSQIDRVLDKWTGDDSPTVRDLDRDMFDVSFGIASEVFLGRSLDADREGVQDAQRLASATAVRRMFSPWNPPIHWPTPRNVRFRRAMRQIDGLVERQLEGGTLRLARRAIPHNVLSVLLDGVDLPRCSVAKKRQLVDELKTILMVGHETSGVSAAWSLHLLSCHPEIQQRIHDEVRGVVGERAPQADDLERMPFLRQVHLEALRTYPAVPFILRSALVDDEIEGAPIPSGSTLVIAPWVTHRHPEFWDDPQRFDPSRFADGEFDFVRAGAYLPFGAGPRRCIGEFLAQLENQLILARVAQRFRVHAGGGPPPEGRGYISFQPTSGIHAYCVER